MMNQMYNERRDIFISINFRLNIMTQYVILQVAKYAVSIGPAAG